MTDAEAKAYAKLSPEGRGRYSMDLSTEVAKNGGRASSYPETRAKLLAGYYTRF